MPPIVVSQTALTSCFGDCAYVLKNRHTSIRMPMIFFIFANLRAKLLLLGEERKMRNKDFPVSMFF